MILSIHRIYVLKYTVFVGATSIGLPEASCVRKSTRNIRTSDESLLSPKRKSSYVSIMLSAFIVSANRMELGATLSVPDAIANWAPVFVVNIHAVIDIVFVRPSYVHPESVIIPISVMIRN